MRQGVDRSNQSPGGVNVGLLRVIERIELRRFNDAAIARNRNHRVVLHRVPRDRRAILGDDARGDRPAGGVLNADADFVHRIDRYDGRADRAGAKNIAAGVKIGVHFREKLRNGDIIGGRARAGDGRDGNAGRAVQPDAVGKVFVIDITCRQAVGDRAGHDRRIGRDGSTGDRRILRIDIRLRHEPNGAGDRSSAIVVTGRRLIEDRLLRRVMHEFSVCHVASVVVADAAIRAQRVDLRSHPAGATRAPGRRRRVAIEIGVRVHGPVGVICPRFRGGDGGIAGSRDVRGAEVPPGIRKGVVGFIKTVRVGAIVIAWAISC